MQRWDLINEFIRENECKNYLEIGYYKGWSFDKINIAKIAVDPNPCKFPYQESFQYGGVIKYSDSEIYKMTSDEFFEQNKLDFDVIFIDGFHESNQVYRDIQNSLKILRKDGAIFIHDCNPPKYEHTTTGIDGCWTGDVYKAVLRFQKENTGEFRYYTYDTDWGVGKITRAKTSNFSKIEIDYDKGIKDWDFFDKNRQKLLNLKKW